MRKQSSIPGLVLECALSGIIIPVLNKEIVSEYRTVLMREKFHLNTKIVDNLIQTLEYYGEYIEPERLNIELPDPKDMIFYEVVMEKQKKNITYLVTGNLKLFPSEPFIVSPRQLINIINENTIK